MNVNELRDRIVELSHQSATDGEVQAKALGWLNAAYHEIMDSLLPYAPATLQVREEAVADAAGQVVLAKAPYKILRVVDAVTGRSLPLVTPQDLMDIDPLNAVDGAPLKAVMTGVGVRIWPASAAQVVVLYIPTLADLQANGGEETVLLPVVHHAALVWGGLVWSALFERGFGTQGEMLMFQTQWALAKERMKLSLLSHAGLRVQAF